ncbi:AAA family ATPase [Treponema pedis]|uniref:AAA family ATPase n=1 Tax=Treponema pedis TaxID=409322 RepID=A0A7S7AXK5_9SPIR|nr:AAA family ATPase [Treponema pedis]QOW61701.1 AAA family ATPase [Treponema pedis]
MGEYAISYLEKNRYYKVPESLRLKADSENLYGVFNDWLEVITPGVILNYFFNPATNEYSVTYNGITPLETGFGLSATLPVLISLLCCKGENVLLLENPEMHLHPAAQSQGGRLLVKSASLGNQIIIETHSDHIINGIRIAAMEHEIDCHDVIFHFLKRDDFEEPTEIIIPQIDERGKLS